MSKMIVNYFHNLRDHLENYTYICTPHALSLFGDIYNYVVVDNRHTPAQKLAMIEARIKIFDNITKSNNYAEFIKIVKIFSSNINGKSFSIDNWRVFADKYPEMAKYVYNVIDEKTLMFYLSNVKLVVASTGVFSVIYNAICDYLKLNGDMKNKGVDKSNINPCSNGGVKNPDIRLTENDVFNIVNIMTSNKYSDDHYAMRHESEFFGSWNEFVKQYGAFSKIVENELFNGNIKSIHPDDYDKARDDIIIFVKKYYINYKNTWSNRDINEILNRDVKDYGDIIVLMNDIKKFEKDLFYYINTEVFNDNFKNDYFDKNDDLNIIDTSSKHDAKYYYEKIIDSVTEFYQGRKAMEDNDNRIIDPNGDDLINVGGNNQVKGDVPNLEKTKSQLKDQVYQDINNILSKSEINSGDINALMSGIFIVNKDLYNQVIDECFSGSLNEYFDNLFSGMPEKPFDSIFRELLDKIKGVVNKFDIIKVNDNGNQINIDDDNGNQINEDEINNLFNRKFNNPEDIVKLMDDIEKIDAKMYSNVVMKCFGSYDYKYQMLPKSSVPDYVKEIRDAVNEYISNTNVIEDFDNKMLQKGFIHKNDIIKIKCLPINPDIENKFQYTVNFYHNKFTEYCKLISNISHISCENIINKLNNAHDNFINSISNIPQYGDYAAAYEHYIDAISDVFYCKEI